MAYAIEAGAQTDYPYDSRQIANWFIRRARRDGKSLSIMHVLKLVYMAHGWTLAVYDRPLVNEPVEAWKYGPVIPTVYFTFRPHGVYNLDPVEIHEREVEPEIEALLEQVYAMYKDLSSGQLSRLTHIEGGPWRRIYRPGYGLQVIPDDTIKAHYEDKLARASR